MAPRAEPLPAPIPLAEAHRGWNTDGDDDDDHRYYRPTTSVTGTNAADLAGFPTDAALISNGDGGGNSIHPVAIILPVLAGAALLLLAVGGFMIWRRRKRAAGARQSETSTEMSSRTSAAASESVQNLRGGDGGVLYAEKHYPAATEIPPRYEDSQRDRSVSVSTGTHTADPFQDPSYAYNGREYDETPVSPVSETAAERVVTTDGYRHDHGH